MKDICIFCGGAGPFNTRSHIIPESLGGATSPVSRRGITCDGCNNYFGHAVEGKALESFPFSIYRLLSSTLSKKGRTFRAASGDSKLIASGKAGYITLQQKIGTELQELKPTGRPGEFTFPFPVKQSPEIVRMLLKIGLEELAQEAHDLVLSKRFDAARTFCREPKRNSEWWILLHTDPAAMLSGLTASGVQGAMGSGCIGGPVYSLLRLPGISTYVPLEMSKPPEDWSGSADPHKQVVYARY